jgi:hypothetical protein
MTKLQLWEIITLSIDDDKWHTLLFYYKRGDTVEGYIDDVMVFKRKLSKRTVKLIVKNK